MLSHNEFSRILSNKTIKESPESTPELTPSLIYSQAVLHTSSLDNYPRKIVSFCKKHGISDTLCAKAIEFALHI